MLTDRFVVIDTETTGFSPNKGDRIVEIGFSWFEGGEHVRTDSRLVNPGKSIPEASSKIHGIYDKDVAGMPSIVTVMDELEDSLLGWYPAAYNAPFDFAFLQAESPYPVPELRDWLDPLLWARVLYPEKARSKKLVDMCTLHGICIENAHRAGDDAEATGRLIIELSKKSIKDEPTVEDMLSWQDTKRVQLKGWRR